MEGQRLSAEARRLLIRAGATVEQVIVEAACRTVKTSEPSKLELTDEDLIRAVQDVSQNPESIILRLKQIADDGADSIRVA